MTILMLRHDADELPETVAALKQVANCTEFVRVDPDTSVEMDQQCLQYDSMIVMLPKETPIPALPMKRGVKFVAMIEGELMELVSINPVFKKFEQNQ